ncbi:hypothetical protein [Fluviicola chungangensis]|uniref:Uncharacterized protein n=1 Tax=Fluviicola chungangensis TaxID=2597671 RepID=A0A556N739_9FLAO|nr:hypothetical protein [Fluviicola chungangensis]TSJ47996.1 hypothetical protein FO442_02360 [Fluviicola chungangensis]
MARYKTLKSVAHNIGSSFISTMNYYKGDYVLGHIQKQMQSSGLSKLEIDLLNNYSQPTTLITEPIQSSIQGYVSWFPKLVNDSGSDISLVTQAKLIIEFDFTKSRICPFAQEYTENPYICHSTITDDRGKEYSYEFKDWWFPGALVIEQKETTLWTKLIQWIRKK